MEISRTRIFSTRTGRLLRSGKNIIPPKGATIIDASGKHVTAGLIDCHSHTAISEGVNEAGQAISAEVRIGDVVDGNDVSVYRELAGGLTAAHLLHGSANPIGGQNQVVKLRWGMLPDQMKFEGAPDEHQIRTRRESKAIQLGRQIHDTLSAIAHGSGTNHQR